MDILEHVPSSVATKKEYYFAQPKRCIGRHGLEQHYSQGQSQAAKRGVAPFTGGVTHKTSMLARPALSRHAARSFASSLVSSQN